MLSRGKKIDTEPFGQIEVLGDLEGEALNRPGEREQRRGGEGALSEGIDEQARSVAIKLYKNGTPVDDVTLRVKWLIDLNLHSRSPLLLAPTATFVMNGCVGEVSPLFQGASTLFEVLYTTDPSQQLSLKDRLQIAVQLVMAIAALERAGIPHGDISANNLLVRRRSNGTWKLKLIDFTRSFVPPGGSPLSASAIQGTRLYLPPEVNKGGAKKKDMKSDRFALAILLLELLCSHPYMDLTGNDLDDAMAKAWKPPRRMNASALYSTKALNKELIGLFRRGINPNRDRRSTPEEWRDALLIAFHSIMACPRCYGLMIADLDRTRCVSCGKPFPPLRLVAGSGVEIPLDKPVVVIGRESLGAASTVSRNHAIIRRYGAAEYFIEPVEDSAKTMIAGGTGWHRIKTITPIAAGMCIRFADVDAYLEVA